MSAGPPLPADLASAVDGLCADLSAIFGPRLKSLVAFGPRLFPPQPHAGRGRRPPLETLALVDALSFDDLHACAGRTAGWQERGLALPLLLGDAEFVRSLDVFPFEYGDIVARHVVVAGPDPFAGVSVRLEDLRRACEAQSKGHLIHLREGYLATAGRADAIADLLTAAAAPFATLLGHVARLRGLPAETPDALAAAVRGIAGASPVTVGDVVGLVQGRVIGDEEARRLFPPYLETVTRLVEYLDTWTEASAE